MPLILPLGWVDTWALACVLRRQQRDLRAEEDGALRLRLSDEAGDHPDLKSRWQLAGNVIGRARRRLREARQAIPALAAFDIVSVDLESLPGGTVVPWSQGEDEISVHIGIVTNPEARLYVGTEMWSLGVGYVVALTPAARVFRSAANFGETARFHLEDTP
jgi:hypothetical protein